ncbi:MAG: hypothetical protein FIB08_05970 [Candidatus Methanoperedens sp.]|nr:hypothetical protein [Candidatus Methanoperedens sp.]
MKYHPAIIIIFIIIMVFYVLPVPSLAIDNGYARLVYNVRGLQDYDLHWNDRFPQGSVIQIYAETDGINHRREVAVDYVFIIKDSNDNIVDTAAYSNRYHDYRENDFLIYSREVPADWEDGVYNAEIHLFDLLNASIMDRYYLDVTTSYLNGSSKPDVPVMSRGDVLNLSQTEKSRQIINITKTFYIDKYASKYPLDRFRVENIKLDKTSVAPREAIHVSASVVNNFYEKGSTSLSLLLDNKQIDNVTVEIEGFSTRSIEFVISSETLGNHTLEIVPTGSNTIGLNLFTTFEVSSGKKIELPTTFDIKDLQIDNLSVEPNKPVVISVTVENIGQDGSQPVELYINDMLEETKDVWLNYSEIRDVKFNITKGDLGAYRVTVGKSNLSKIFFVESVTVTPVISPPEEPGVQKKEKTPQLVIIIGLSIVVIFIFIIRLYLRRKLK